MKDIISKNYFKFLENKLFEIENAIMMNMPKHNRMGVLDGKMGIALFYYWLYKYTKDEKYINTCIDIVYEVVESIGRKQLGSYYYNGLAGIVWAVEYFINKDLFHKEDSILSATKNILIKNANKALDYNNYEFMSGAIGYMFPFIQSKNEVELNKFVKSLIKKVEKQGECFKWKSIDFNDDSEMYCLGLAHGMAGIVRVISKLIKLKLIDPEHFIALEKIYNFYIDTIEKKYTTSSLLPNSIKNNDQQLEKGRLGWCHGDLGVGITFLNSGIDTNSEKLINLGNKLLLNYANRRNLSQENIIDSCICHGTVSLSHIFYKAYSSSNEKMYLDACHYWLDQTFKLPTHNNDTLGFQFHLGQQGWKESISLLNGITGTGLSILTMLSSESIDWDECLLLT